MPCIEHFYLAAYLDVGIIGLHIGSNGAEDRVAALRECFRAKSQENWEAAEMCRASDKMNAAASRLYYSLYLAARYWADKLGIFRIHEWAADIHETTANIIGNNAGANAKDYRYLMGDLKQLRVTADYRPEHVIGYEIERVIEKAGIARTFFLS